MTDSDEIVFLYRIFLAAKELRKKEQEATPILYRGKNLHDLSLELDNKLEAYKQALLTR